MKNFNIFISCFYFVCFSLHAQNITSLQVPGKNLFCKINQSSVSVLPSGRFVKPVGKVSTITNDPFGLSISKDGKYAVTLHNGVLTIYNLHTDSITRVPDYDKKIPSPFINGSFIGISFHSNSKTIFLSGGDSGNVIEYDIENLKIVNSYSLNGEFKNVNFKDSFTSDLLYDDLHNELLVLDQANYRLVKINCDTKTIIASIPVGRIPFGIALSPDHSTAIVANVGMYAYPLIEGINQNNYDSMLITRHPYAHVSNESILGTQIENKIIPGVGDPNVNESMSVFVVDLLSNEVKYRIKTGYLVGQMLEDAEVIGGASPNSIAIFDSYAYVTNATNDNIAVIDYKAGIIIKHIPIQVDSRIDKYRGYLPFGIEISKDGSTLYTALLGFNAVGVIDVKSSKTLGAIPTGWGPTRVKLSPNQKELYIISARGFGAGPNGGENFIAPPQGTYIGDIQLATFQRLNVPDSALLSNYTKSVLSYTFIEEPIISSSNPMPYFPGEKQSPIKYIVYITKENRTYDEVFGQISSGNGDSSLSKLGLRVDIKMRKEGKDSTIIKNVNVSPNHHKIASTYAFSDNFYCDSDASIHGHHWMMGVIPNEWVEANSNTSKTAKYFSTAPGRRYPGSTGSMDPEDFAEIGGLWEALERKGVSFYNFGEANETAHVRESWFDTATGAAHGVMVPMQKALFTRTSHNYAGFNTNIPDQFRMNQFESEFKKMWLTGKSNLPSLITMQVPNDHGAGIRPQDGYPYPQSYMADNDLAIGRILHFLSRTPYWKNMLVIITEDDPQGGVDHLDAHRSILMLAGPYVKRDYTSHTHANFGSILKTIYNILGVPYVNQYDATASSLSDFFTDKPDFAVYNLEYPDKRIFDPTIALKKYKIGMDWKKILQGPDMDDVKYIKKSHYSNN